MVTVGSLQKFINVLFSGIIADPYSQNIDHNPQDLPVQWLLLMGYRHGLEFLALWLHWTKRYFLVLF